MKETKDKNTNKILFMNIFTNTIYTFRDYNSPNNINYTKQLPFTQEFITIEEAKEIYLKSREIFFRKPGQTTKEDEKTKTRTNKPKSKLRTRRYID